MEQEKRVGEEEAVGGWRLVGDAARKEATRRPAGTWTLAVYRYLARTRIACLNPPYPVPGPPASGHLSGGGALDREPERAAGPPWGALLAARALRGGSTGTPAARTHLPCSPACRSGGRQALPNERGKRGRGWGGARDFPLRALTHRSGWGTPSFGALPGPRRGPDRAGPGVARAGVRGSRAQSRLARHEPAAGAAVFVDAASAGCVSDLQGAADRSSTRRAEPGPAVRPSVRRAGPLLSTQTGSTPGAYYDTHRCHRHHGVIIKNSS
ncbi:hypothetical protein CDD83_8975 [Cordyceps sp. RAO-2017]|nr:hypothetical protein CDD83_8975 [Cordyceps sp. RAO-2017]